MWCKLIQYIIAKIPLKKRLTDVIVSKTIKCILSYLDGYELYCLTGVCNNEQVEKYKTLLSHHWKNERRHAICYLDCKDRIYQTVKKAFVCLCVSNRFLNHSGICYLRSVKVFLKEDEEESLLIVT